MSSGKASEDTVRSGFRYRVRATRLAASAGASARAYQGNRGGGYDQQNARSPAGSPAEARAARGSVRAAAVPPPRGRTRGARGPVRDDQGGRGRGASAPPSLLDPDRG